MSDTDNAAAPAAQGSAKPQSPLMVIRGNVERMLPDFKAALPEHIPAERFVRTALTAIQLNPDIAACEPKTVYAACMKAAQDGLVLDGREAALVKFNQKMKIDGNERYVNVAQYMPMVQGILKKARNSGEISYIAARVVYDKDRFHVVYGDEESLTHEPFLDGEPGEMRLAYMVAKLKDGQIVREIMTKAQIEKVRSKSRSADRGPWKDWPEEMWRKTVIRRGAKYLPSSSDRSDGSDVLDLVSRDDPLFENAPDGEELPLGDPGQADQQTRQRRQRQPRQSNGGAGSKLNTAPEDDQGGQTGGPVDLVEWTDPATGEVLMLTPAEIEERAKAAPPAKEATPAAQPSPQPAQPAQPAQQAPAPQQQAKPAAAAPTSAAAKLNSNDDGMDPPAFLRPQSEPPPPGVDDVI